MTTFDDPGDWQHLRDEARTLARMHRRMFYVIGKGRPARVHDSDELLPREYRIDYVAFPGGRR